MDNITTAQGAFTYVQESLDKEIDETDEDEEFHLLKLYVAKHFFADLEEANGNDHWPHLPDTISFLMYTIPAICEAAESSKLINIDHPQISNLMPVEA